MAESKFATKTAYHSITPAYNDMSDRARTPPKMELGNHPQVAGKRSWLSTIFWQTFALLWLVPVVALLYLNFTTHIIGASAWCPAGQCWINAFNYVSAVPQERMKRFDKEDHNLLGGLQFVAKILEVWFGIIAAALIYLITMRFAGKKEGLPIGYLTRPMEFGDVVGLFDSLFWMTGPTPYGIKSASEKRVGRRVWSLIALSVFLCILINLMGPATAVLVIPSLQWVTTNQVGNRMFQALNGGHPPGLFPGTPPSINYESWMWWDSSGCNAHDFRTHNFSCSLTSQGQSMDVWIDSALAAGGASSGLTVQGGLTFTVNQTIEAATKNSLDQLTSTNDIFTDTVFWAPSRQIISNMSVDRLAIERISQGENRSSIWKELRGAYHWYPDPIETYEEYNKSLQLNIRRDGPVVGAVMNKWVGYNGYGRWTVDVDTQRQIRCYANYDLWNFPLAEGSAFGNYTKCIRLGAGWSNENKMTSFYAPGSYDAATKKQGPDVTINAYSSDRAVFLPNGTLPSWLPAACLSNGKLSNGTSCDWHRLFATDPTSSIANRTEHVNTIEMTMQDRNITTVLAVDFVAYLAFATYVFDPFWFSNPTSYVQTETLPTSGTAFAMDPSWQLAAWSVGPGGSLFINRTSTNLLLDVMTRLGTNTDENVVLGLQAGDWKIDFLSFFPVMQALSLVDHSTIFTSETSTKDPNHPLLQRNANMYVWAYGMGSRTSYLGAVVAVLGCLVVVWQFVLGFVDRRRFRSPTQLLVASLEHSPRGEFEGKGHEEKEMARVRFHIRDDDNRVGKYSFYEPDAAGS